MFGLGVAGFVLWLMVLIRQFKSAGALHGIIGIICGIYTFIWGWMNHRQEDLTKLMKIWTGVVVAQFILPVIMIFTGMGMFFMGPGKDMQQQMDMARQQAIQQQVQQQQAAARARKARQQAAAKGQKTSVQIKDAEIISYGIYDIQTSGETIKNKMAEEGERVLMEDYALKRQTTKIPGEIGTYFGFEYILRGSPDAVGKPVLLKIHTEQKNPNNDQIVLFESETPEEAYIGDIQLVAYKISNRFETMPGKWQFELIYDDKPVENITFFVGPEAELDSIAPDNVKGGEQEAEGGVG
jgi:hypothetical protein